MRIVVGSNQTIIDAAKEIICYWWNERPPTPCVLSLDVVFEYFDTALANGTKQK